MIRVSYLFAALAALFLAAPAAAQSATPLGQFRDWAAYVAETSNGKVCYVLSQPKQMQPSNVNRDPVYFFITSRPDQGVNNEVSVVIGYPYQDGSQSTAEIGSDSFTLFTKDDGAWVENAAEENRLVEAMRAGMTMVVKGTSRRGTNTTDNYSLAGISAALDKMGEECQ